MVIGSPSGSSITHSALKRSPCFSNRARTSSRFHTSRTSGMSSAMIRRISSSIAGKSSSVKGPRSAARREVVIEAVVGRRTESDLGAGIKPLHCLGEDVREIVADQFQRVLLVAAT